MLVLLSSMKISPSLSRERLRDWFIFIKNIFDFSSLSLSRKFMSLISFWLISSNSFCLSPSVIFCRFSSSLEITTSSVCCSVFWWLTASDCSCFNVLCRSDSCFDLFRAVGSFKICQTWGYLVVNMLRGKSTNSSVGIFLQIL